MLGFEFLDPLELTQRHARVLALPLVVGRSTDAVFGIDLHHRQARFPSAQDRHDPGFREPRLPHLSPPKMQKSLLSDSLRFGWGYRKTNELSPFLFIDQ